MNPGDPQDWLTQAEGDLHYARLGQHDASALPNLIAFHAQQAIEKALKGVLVAQQLEFPKTHDLEVLLLLIRDAELNWPPELDKAKEFTPFAVQSRYPGFDDPITQTDVAEAIAIAEQVIKWANRFISK